MDFDPDAYLNADSPPPSGVAPPVPTAAPTSDDFDPDAYLSSAGGADVSTDDVARDQRMQAYDKNQAQYGGVGQQAIAGLEGAAQGLVGPLAPAAEVAAGVDPEDIRARAEANPITHGIGEFGGFGAGMLAGTGEAALLGKAGEAAAGAAGLGTIGSAAVRGATEMALLQSGDEVSKMILQDPAQSAETAAMNIGLSGLMGATGGAAIGVVSPLWKATAGDKLGQFLEDFRGRFKERIDNPNPVEALTKELTDLHTGITSTADEVYGANGLKAQEIQKVMPEMNDKMISQANDISKNLQATITHMENGPNRYPERLVSNLKDDLNEFNSRVWESPKPAVAYIAPNEKYAVTIGHTTELMDEPKVKGAYTQAKIEKVPVLQEDVPGNPTFPEDLDTKMQLYQGGNTKSPGEIFNAIQDLKQKLQGYSKFDKFVKPVDEAYGFVQKAKNLQHGLRESLEDPDVWGQAAERQQAINGAFSKYLPTLKDFQSKFMTEINGEKIIDPGKINTYVNQLGKPNAEIKQQVLENFLNATDKYKAALSDTHANLGLENPFPASSTSAINSSLKKIPAGAKLADILINKGLANLGGQGLGAAIGGAAGHLIGAPGFGALIGEHALGPFLSSVLPAIGKPMMENPAVADGFKQTVDYGISVVKGEKLLNSTMKNLFKSGAEVLDENAVPNQRDRERLDKALKSAQNDPQSMMKVGGAIGSYMPNHAAVIAATSMNAVNYLNNLRPREIKNAPLDQPFENPFQKETFERAMNIAEQPLLVVQHLKDGTLLPGDTDALKSMFPSLYTKLSQKLTEQIIEHTAKGEDVPYNMSVGLSMFLGSPLDSTMSQASIMSAQMAQNRTAAQDQQNQAQPAPKGRSLKSLNKMGEGYATASQAREAQAQSSKS